MAVVKSTPTPFQTGPRLIGGEALNFALAANIVSCNSGLTAAGSTNLTALALTAVINQLATVGSGTGVILPANPVPGQRCVVMNDGANTLTVYANDGSTIDTVAGATGVSLTKYVAATTPGKAVFFCIAPLTWESALLGQISS